MGLLDLIRRKKKVDTLSLDSIKREELKLTVAENQKLSQLEKLEKEKEDIFSKGLKITTIIILSLSTINPSPLSSSIKVISLLCMCLSTTQINQFAHASLGRRLKFCMSRPFHKCAGFFTTSSRSLRAILKSLMSLSFSSCALDRCMTNFLLL